MSVAETFAGVLFAVGLFWWDHSWWKARNRG